MCIYIYTYIYIYIYIYRERERERERERSNTQECQQQVLSALLPQSGSCGGGGPQVYLIYIFCIYIERDLHIYLFLCLYVLLLWHVNNKFSVRYYLNLVLLDEEDRRWAGFLYIFTLYIYIYIYIYIYTSMRMHIYDYTLWYFNKFSVRYYLNLMLVDEEDRTYVVSYMYPHYIYIHLCVCTCMIILWYFNKFSVRYYLNLMLVGEEDRRYI